MKYIKIKNFGPIKEGFCGESDAGKDMMPIYPVTFFCGIQGSGKSTVAKLISIFTWIEKGLVRGDIIISRIDDFTKFFKKRCKFHRIQNYFKDNTEMIFYGTKYDFEYKNLKFIITPKNKGVAYLMPKIMYIPAERNMLSVIENINIIKDLPESLFAMLDEYDKAKKTLKEDLYLPIEGYKYRYRYDKDSNTSYLVGDDYEVKLSEAASGFQSMVPMYLVTQYLSFILLKKESASKNIELQDRVNQRIRKYLEDDTLSDDMRKTLIAQQSTLFRYDNFINIVEEPEVNLYPTSQRDILYALLRSYNYHKNNELIITTHSPYMINYLSLTIMAYNLQENDKVDKDKLDKIIGSQCRVNGKEVCVYELRDGKIEKLKSFEDMPSDENLLNMELEETNDKFDELMDLL